MSLDYTEIFKQKTGLIYQSTPDIDDTSVNSYLDQAAYYISRNYSTPWNSFSDITEKYKYGVTILAAIEYWWSKVAEFVRFLFKN